MLTDEKLAEAWREATRESIHGSRSRFARAIEAAATAPLLERIAELEAKLAQGVPDGWKLVPVDPTPEMKAAGLAYFKANWDDIFTTAEHYRLMLSAAPAAPEQQDIPPEMADVLNKYLWELYSDGSAPEQQKECWCETCDLSQGNPMGRTRMSVCPQCGDKRCPLAKHHDSACQVAQAPNAQQAEAQEPCAWANFTEDGSIRIWSKKQESAAWAGLDLEPLFTRPQPAQPLTRDQVSQMLQAAGYFAASPQENADFINGVRHAEIAHGIGVAK